jgi:hypothetical protein
VSALVATVRPHLVERVAATIAAQQHVDIELVLVTHGFALSRKDVRQVRRIAGRPVTVRSADSDVVFGDVLNLALEAASGDVVTKMDDDDYYGPHHVEDLLQSLTWSGAALVGAVDEFTYLSDLDLTVRHRRPGRHEITVERVPGPTMTMRRADLVALGGWAAVPAHVDRELNDAVLRSGAGAHATHGLGYLRCRHGDRHTWPRTEAGFLRASLTSRRGLHPPPELPLAPALPPPAAAPQQS